MGSIGPVVQAERSRQICGSGADNSSAPHRLDSYKFRQNRSFHTTKLLVEIILKKKNRSRECILVRYIQQICLNFNFAFVYRRIPGESRLTFESVSRQLYRLRDKQYPERPSTDEALKDAFGKADIFVEYGRTLDKRRPLYAGSVVKRNYAFHAFASFGVVDLIKKHIPPNERKFLMDGTFKIVPRRFRQLLIIAIEYNNDVSIYTFV